MIRRRVEAAPGGWGLHGSRVDTQLELLSFVFLSIVVVQWYVLGENYSFDISSLMDIAVEHERFTCVAGGKFTNRRVPGRPELCLAWPRALHSVACARVLQTAPPLKSLEVENLDLKVLTYKNLRTKCDAWLITPTLKTILV